MSSGEVRYPYAVALPVAERLRELLAPACERIIIAGSVRREKPDVGDVELVAIPKPAPSAWFNDGLDTYLQAMLGAGTLSYRLNKKGSIQYGPSNKFLTDVASGIPVDIFTADARNYGIALMVRTGPADLNVRMMSHFKAIGFKGYIYGVRNRQGEEQDCETEEQVFRLLGWPFKQPKERV